jgi:hypothetical protein
MQITSNQVIASSLVVIASPVVLVGGLLWAGAFAGLLDSGIKQVKEDLPLITWTARNPQCIPRMLWAEANGTSAGGIHATHVAHCRN